MNSLTIGSVITKPNLILAPMSGVTNSSFRRLIREENGSSLGLVVTEFISIEALTRGQERSKLMMKFQEVERPISIQIFGYDIGRMVDAAKMVEQVGAEIVDINSGCPVPKVVRRGGGCELMRQPLHMASMLNEVAKAVKIPLTLKIRSGWNENSKNALEIAKIAEESGVKMLTIHGRTREQLYRGESDWDIISDVADQVKIPVVGSGDIVDGPSALKALNKNVSGIMIGRGALSNPWIFKDIEKFRQGIEVPKRSLSEVIRVLLRYKELLIEDVPERAVLGKLKQLISQSIKEGPVLAHNGGEIAQLRRDLCRMIKIDEVETRLKQEYEKALN